MRHVPSLPGGCALSRLPSLLYKLYGLQRRSCLLHFLPPFLPSFRPTQSLAQRTEKNAPKIQDHKTTSSPSSASIWTHGSEVQ